MRARMARMRARIPAMALALGAMLACACAGAVLAQAGDSSQRLRRLFEQSSLAAQQRFPLGALYRGESRRVAQFGEYLTDAHVAAGRESALADLQELAGIERALLSAPERVAYDAFRWQREIDLRWSEPRFRDIWLRLPFDQFNGFHLGFPTLSSGSGAARYRSVEDYEDGLSRIEGFIAWLERAMARFREGAGAGIVHPRPVVERMVEQFAALLAQGVEGSVFYGPVRAIPDGIAPAERERLRLAYATAIRERILPAFTRMHEFLSGWYLARTRESVGLYRIPGGEAYYRHLVEVHTTTRLSPDEIHALGRAEVERIRARMDEIRVRTGFEGPLPAFFEHVRGDPQFRPASAAAIAERYRAIGARVQAALPRLFPKLPRAALEVRAEPAWREKSAPYARYESGSADASRPGVFYYNTRDLASRSVIGMEALYLHEALPGHHLQIGIARESAQLPPFLRYREITAFSEGWALYAETLGPELGLYADPWQRFGALDQEMWRALRLVVDTGIHWMGWRREEAIDYMLAHSSTSRTDAVAEVERYIAWPGQALAYKIGQLTITRLRAKARDALGERFDVRDFHDVVLATGSLPLPVLEAKVDAWIAARKAP